MRAERVISSIPRENPDAGVSDENKCPHKRNDSGCPVGSQSDGPSNWVYPSPKMFWEAMNRKGTLPSHLSDPQNPQAQEELEWIVTIHNVVNEQCWQEICKWERFRVEGCNKESSGDTKTDVEIKLQRFLGRPDDLSPRAWFKSNILGYRKPFDRHDWYVIGGPDPNSPPRRYIIDFYAGRNSEKGTSTSFHLDVRPALDTMNSFELRVKKYLCEKMKEFQNKFKL